MRILRFTLLQSYFSFINKNKKKALILINVGIFFTIFAISSAIISFVIEKKISDNQNDLLAIQISDMETSTLISSLETMFSNFDLALNNEERNRIEKKYLSETKLGNKIFSENDFYSPYIHHVFEVLKEFEREIKTDSDNLFTLEDILDINNEVNQELLIVMKAGWEDDKIKEYIDAVELAKEKLEKVKKIDFENYKLNKIPSFKDISEEILNYKLHHINRPDSKIEDDYYLAIEFQFAIRVFFKEFLKIIKGMHLADQTKEEIITKNILSLSNMEKNIILLTFIFQLIVFIIIQFFEVNSLDYNLRKRKK